MKAGTKAQVFDLIGGLESVCPADLLKELSISPLEVLHRQLKKLTENGSFNKVETPPTVFCVIPEILAKPDQLNLSGSQP